MPAPPLKSNLREFNAAVRKWAKNRPPAETLKVQRALTLDLFGRVTLRTPVDTGRARAGWLVSSNDPDYSVPGKGNHPRPPLNEALAALGSLRPFGVAYLQNNVLYISFLEEGRPGPGSPQAPSGMLAVSLAELREVFP